MAGPSPTSPQDRHSLAGAIVFTERWILSVIYLALAGWILWQDVAHGFGWVSSGGAIMPTVPDAATDVLLFVMQFFVGIMLLTARRPVMQQPTRREIFVPLAAAFFFLAYDALPWFPAVLQENLSPTAWPESLLRLHPLDAAGLVAGMIGPAISLWGVLALRRSFGIFVSVREVVLRGPYRYVRHPIYLGYVFTYGGLVLLDRSIAITLLVAIHFALFAWRARLEETRLAAHSPAYREHMRHTGFFFPRLFRG